HQSLWASNMHSGMMLPIAERLDQAGFVAIELIAGALFKKCVRELKEDPFELIRQVRRRITRTPLRLIASRINPFEHDPQSMYRLSLELSAAAGMREIRISDPWNHISYWEPRVRLAREVGLDPVVNLIYSVSPKHSDEFYAERTRMAASLPVHRLCFKDPGGLLTPERVKTLAPVILANSGGHEVEFHGHCTTGLGPLSAQEAITAGITIINTSLPPLADGASLPSLHTIASNARAMGHTTAIDEDVLGPVSDHFRHIAKREGFPIGRPAEYDESQYLHQVPGGMITNLGHQLKMVGLEDRLPAALEETKQVRAEFAYPIMVTPLSQFVGSQAVINIVVGERYKVVTDQTIDYALGRYGEEGAEGMDPEVKAKILDRPRARERAAREIPEPSLAEMRKKFGGPGVSVEELLLLWIATKDDVDAMRAAGMPDEYLTSSQPLVTLVRELTKRTDCNAIRLNRPGFSLILEKGAASA
ncbi:MAG: pyruvate carboxylase subunit B, partial [Alphaproteobacteria bacterium]